MSIPTDSVSGGKIWSPEHSQSKKEPVDILLLAFFLSLAAGSIVLFNINWFSSKEVPDSVTMDYFSPATLWECVALGCAVAGLLMILCLSDRIVSYFCLPILVGSIILLFYALQTNHHQDAVESWAKNTYGYEIETISTVGMLVTDISTGEKIIVNVQENSDSTVELVKDEWATNDIPEESAQNPSEDAIKEKSSIVTDAKTGEQYAVTIVDGKTVTEKIE